MDTYKSGQFGLLGQARLRGKFSKAAIIKLFSRCLNYPRLQVRLIYQLLFMNFHKSAFLKGQTETCSIQILFHEAFKCYS